jgi:Zn-dependent peptidase ImmA (M78 family)/DNA-binding XRE family transcriptional regulator
MKKNDLRKLIGNNIKNSIKEMGYKQDFVAEKLDISRQTLNNYMSGITPIDIEKLVKLSELLNRDIDFFYKDNYEFGRYLFRSDSEVNNSTKVKFEERFRKYLEIEKLIGKETIPYMLEVYLEKFNKEFINNIAQKLRCFWNIGLDDPIANTINLLESNGIKVLQFDSSEDGLSGFSAFNSRIGYCIYVNNTCTAERQIFTAIHELAHFIFHRSDYQRDLISKVDDEKEEIANYFAGVFLIPGNSLIKFCEANYFSNIDFQEVCDIKRYFKVSAEAIIKRLAQENLINKSEYKKLREEANKDVGPEGEREPLSEKDFTINYRFISMIKNAYLEKRVTTSKVAKLMDLSAIESNRLAERWLTNG